MLLNTFLSLKTCLSFILYYRSNVVFNYQREQKTTKLVEIISINTINIKALALKAYQTFSGRQWSQCVLWAMVIRCCVVGWVESLEAFVHVHWPEFCHCLFTFQSLPRILTNFTARRCSAKAVDSEGEIIL